ncbi:MAG: hypothetical protein L3J74_15225 [Bacteroidales bacterium]|nr:hypothetical protein [Bacteroidales bacterium]
MGLRKLKEYRNAPQMRVLKSEPDKNGKFPARMIIVLLAVLVGTITFKDAQNNDDETIKEFVKKTEKSDGKTRERFKICINILPALRNAFMFCLSATRMLSC